jgi:hypothetical protein
MSTDTKVHSETILTDEVFAENITVVKWKFYHGTFLPKQPSRNCMVESVGMNFHVVCICFVYFIYKHEAIIFPV